MPDATLPSLFDRATLGGLAAATDQARVRDDTDGLRRCERVSAAVAAADARRIDEARRTLNEALHGAHDVRLLFLGFQFAFRTGDFDAAEDLTRRRLECAETGSADAARAWTNLGLVHLFRGEPETATVMMRRAINIDRAIGDDEGLARDLGNFALVFENRGDLGEAERLTRESLAVADRIGAAHIVAGKLCNLGEILLATGRRGEALSFLARAEAAFRELGVEKHRKHCATLLDQLSISEGS